MRDFRGCEEYRQVELRLRMSTVLTSFGASGDIFQRGQYAVNSGVEMIRIYLTVADDAQTIEDK